MFVCLFFYKTCSVKNDHDNISSRIHFLSVLLGIQTYTNRARARGYNKNPNITNRFSYFDMNIIVDQLFNVLSRTSRLPNNASFICKMTKTCYSKRKYRQLYHKQDTFEMCVYI